ncbi:hypothetical protein [uncultured Roseovarius sp.]|uniref:hypothetical protein n=1 Tax=uncultured Roseovarius sp. TaxID=293344 RepID=UPI00261319D0|nr:hypothetical protein [uncultured Roseovarius sp.]
MSTKQDIKIALGLALLFFGVLAAFALIRHYVFGSTWQDLLWETLFIGTLITLGLLSQILPFIDRVMKYGLVYYLIFTAIVFALMIPGIAYFKAAQLMAESETAILRTGFFVVSGAIWLGLVSLLCPSKPQAWLFSKLKTLGWFTPLIFLFNYIAVSVVLFGFFAFYLYGPGSDGSLDSDSYLNFFGYHFLDSIPALKVPDTLQLTEPLPGDRPVGLGFLLLLFKLAVLIPAIGAFRAYWKSGEPTGTP